MDTYLPIGGGVRGPGSGFDLQAEAIGTIPKENTMKIHGKTAIMKFLLL